MLRDDLPGEHLDFPAVGGLGAIARIDDEIVRRVVQGGAAAVVPGVISGGRAG